VNIEGIVFNPYEENIDLMVAKIKDYIASNDAETAFENLAEEMYLDNSRPWKQLIAEVFRDADYGPIITKQYKTAISDNRTDVLPQFTYLIVCLLSANMMPDQFLTKKLVRRISHHESKDILMSFLASWDLNKALELDEEYVVSHFRHMKDASTAPIKNLILNSTNEMYFKVVEGLLQEPKVQYHFYQTLQHLLRSSSEMELNQVEAFVIKCCSNEHQQVTDFACDLFELSTIRGFLASRWGHSLTEKLYRYFSSNKSTLTAGAESAILMSLNRMRGKLEPQYALAARHRINNLRENDRDFIQKVVERASSSIIDGLADGYPIPINEDWDWKDYAYKFVSFYKSKHPEALVVDVVHLANDLGLTLVQNAFETDDFDACLVRDRTLAMPIIIVNTSKKSKGRINFSIAHEIAHAVIPRHADKTFFCFLSDVSETGKIRMDKHLEEEANQFAAYVLVPDREFKVDVEKLNFNMSNIQKLSQKYGASLVLVTRKWIEHTTLAIAMVFSVSGIIDWVFTSDTFPYKWLDHIDEMSTVFKVIGGNPKLSPSMYIDSSCWINGDYARHRLLEESYRIFDDKVLTILQIVEDD